MGALGVIDREKGGRPIFGPRSEGVAASGTQILNAGRRDGGRGSKGAMSGGKSRRRFPGQRPKGQSEVPNGKGKGTPLSESPTAMARQTVAEREKGRKIARA